MATVMASLINPPQMVAPNYETKISNSTSTADDTVGPLPDVKLYIPKGGFQAQKTRTGLPINPSPHSQLTDPAIQDGMWKPQDNATSPVVARSPPLESKAFQMSPQMASMPFQASPPLSKPEQMTIRSAQTSPELIQVTSKRTSTSSQASATRYPMTSPPMDRETQTSNDLLRRSSSASSLDCRYCRGCQQRLRSRSNTDDWNSSASTSPKQPPPRPPQPSSPPLAKKGMNIARKFKLGVLQRSSTKSGKTPVVLTKKPSEDKENADEKVELDIRAAKRATKRFVDFETISPTDHWANE